MINEQDNDLFAVFSKKNISFCEKYFIDKLQQDFPNHLDLIIKRVTEKIQTAPSFKDKQILTDINRKITLNKKSINEQFIYHLKSNLNFLIISNSGKFSLVEIKLTESKEFNIVEESKKNLESSIAKVLGDMLSSVLRATNYLLGKEQDIFRPQLLTETLHKTFKDIFTNIYSINLILNIFEETWPEHLIPYYDYINEFLSKNNVFEQIENTMSREQPKVDTSIVPDFNSFLEKIEPFYDTEELENQELALKNSLQDCVNKNISLIDKIKFPKNLIEDLSKIQFFENYTELNSEIVKFEPFLNTIKNINNTLISFNNDNFNDLVFQKNIIYEIGSNEKFQKKMNIQDKFVFETLSNFYESIFNNKDISLKSKILLYKTQLYMLFNFLKNDLFFQEQNSDLQFINFVLEKEIIINNEFFRIINEYILSLNAEEVLSLDSKPVFGDIIKSIIDLKVNYLSEFKEQTSILINKLEHQENMEYSYNTVSNKMKIFSEKTKNKAIQAFVNKVFPYYYIHTMSKNIDLNILFDENFVLNLSLTDKVKWNQNMLLFEDIFFISNLKEIAISQQAKIKEKLISINSGLAKLAVDYDIPEKLIKIINNIIKMNFDNISSKNFDKNILIKLESNFIDEVEKLVISINASNKAEEDMTKNKFELKKYINQTHLYTFSNQSLFLINYTNHLHFFIFINLENKEIIEYSKYKLWYFIKNKVFKPIVIENIDLPSILKTSLYKIVK